MGIWDNMKENAQANVDKSTLERKEKAQKEATPFLLDGENVESIHLQIEDFIILTNQRVLFVNKNVFSSKKQITTIPYAKISSINLEKGGFMNFTKEVEIHVGSARYEVKMFSEKDVIVLYNELVKKII